MELRYDQGTLLIKPNDPKTILPIDHHIRRDERVNAFRALGMSYHHVRARLTEAPENLTDHIAASFLIPESWRSPELRPYQELALNSWENQDYKGIICLPTGSGKTITAIGAMLRSKSSTLCIVPTLILMHQWAESLRLFYDGPVGLLGDGYSTIEAITVTTFESAYRKMGEIGHLFQLLVLDEVHHFGRGVRDELLQMSVSPQRLGLTATPPNSPEVTTALDNLIGPVVFQLDVKDLSGTWLAPFDHFCLRLNLTSEEKHHYQTTWKVYAQYRQWYQKSCPEGSWEDFLQTAQRTTEGRKALASRREALSVIHFSEAKQETLASILMRHRRQKCLIFTADTASAIAISRKFLVPSITGDIQKRERDQIVNSYQTGALRCIVACRILNEGFDIPDAEIAIVLGGTQGEREHVQRLGRILRPSPDKKATLYELIARNTCEEFNAKSRQQPLRGKIHDSALV